MNRRQRERVVEKLLDELKILKGRTIGLLGLAFKPDTDDLREAPALDIARKLIERGARVKAHDPVAMNTLQLRAMDTRAAANVEHVESPWKSLYQDRNLGIRDFEVGAFVGLHTSCLSKSGLALPVRALVTWVLRFSREDSPRMSPTLTAT